MFDRESILCCLGIALSKPFFMESKQKQKKMKTVVEESGSDQEWTPQKERKEMAAATKGQREIT